MEKEITEEQPGYSALTDSRSTVKEKTDTELTEGIKKTKNELRAPPTQLLKWGAECADKAGKKGRGRTAEAREHYFWKW